MADPISALLAVGGNVLEFITNQNAQQWNQNQIANRLNAADAWSQMFYNMFENTANPLREQGLRQQDLGNQYLFGGEDGGAFGRQDTNTRALLSMLQNNPNFFNPGLNGGQEEDIRNMQGIMSRLDPAYGSLYDSINSGGRTFDSNLLRDRLFEQVNGAGTQNMVDTGNELLSTRGITGFNQNSLDRAQEVFNAGGATPTSAGLGGAGFDLIASGGWNPQNQAAFNSGNAYNQFALGGGGYTPETAGMANSAMGLFNNTIANGGMTPEISQGLNNAQSLFNT